MIDGSRRQRIARGSGTTVQEVNQLLEARKQMAKVMKGMSKGKLPSVPGMVDANGAAPARAKPKSKRKKKKKKARK
jgi:signal recognition particle subunit SRP54